MPGKFNVGGDASLQIVLASGQLLKPSIITGFSFKQETIQHKVRPLNGRVIHSVVPDGWTGSFDFERADSTIDDYFAQREEDYYAGFRDAEVFITQTIREVQGGISQYRFTGVAMMLDEGGSWKQDDTVKQRINWMGSARKKVI